MGSIKTICQLNTNIKLFIDLAIIPKWFIPVLKTVLFNKPDRFFPEYRDKIGKSWIETGELGAIK